MLHHTEIHAITNRFVGTFGRDVAALAVLRHFSSQLLDRFGKRNGVSFEQLQQVADQCVRARLSELGVRYERLTQARAALRQAGETAELLDAIPSGLMELDQE